MLLLMSVCVCIWQSLVLSHRKELWAEIWHTHETFCADTPRSRSRHMYPRADMATQNFGGWAKIGKNSFFDFGPENLVLGVILGVEFKFGIAEALTCTLGPQWPTENFEGGQNGWNSFFEFWPKNLVLGVILGVESEIDIVEAVKCTNGSIWPTQNFGAWGKTGQS